MSARTKPVTGSVKVIVAVKGIVLVSGTPPIVTVGAVLSSSKVLSFASIGTVFVSALPAVSAISWSEAKASVTVPVRPAKLPPSTVTSWATDEPGTAATVSVAAVTPTSKSASSTFATVSLKVTRQVRLSALVGDDVGLWRAIEATCGAAVSGGENVRSACVFASSPKVVQDRSSPETAGCRHGQDEFGILISRDMGDSKGPLTNRCLRRPNSRPFRCSATRPCAVNAPEDLDSHPDRSAAEPFRRFER